MGRISSACGGFWRTLLAPQKVLLFNCFLVLVVVMASHEFVLEQPFYDLNIQEDPSGVRIRLADGTSHTAVALLSDGDRIALLPDLVRPDPDFLNSFQEIDRYFQHQTRLSVALADPPLVLETLDGSQVRLEPQSRSVTSTPRIFWLLNLMGATAFLTGMAFWAYHPGLAITRILAVGGLGCYVMQASMAIYASRELALDGDIFLGLVHINHLGGMLFVPSLVLMLWLYPTRLSGMAGVLAVYFCAALFWLNEIVEWIEWPLSLFYFPALLMTLFALGLFRAQWLRCKNDIELRKRYGWLVSSILGGLGLTVLLYVLPMLAIGESLVSPLIANGFCLLVYLGFVLGVQFGGLFSVERWWLKACLNVLLAFMVILIDLLMITLLGVQSVLGLSLVALICFWFYLQIRHRFYRWFSPAQESRALVSDLLIDGRVDGIQQLDDGVTEKTLLQALFRPLSCEVTKQRFATPTLVENGLKLGVTFPSPDTHGQPVPPLSIMFVGKSKGQELFTIEDAEFTARLIAHTQQRLALFQEREATLLAERQRIMRDLHDEVAPDLLALSRQLEGSEQAKLSRLCLTNLRDIVYSMDDDKERSLWQALSQWRRDLGNLAEGSGATLNWNDTLDHDVTLTGAQWLQLTKCIRELVNNALRHANPESINISLSLKGASLSIVVSNDGHVANFSDWKTGKGVHSIQRRITDLLGSIRWETDEKICTAIIQVPIGAG